MDSYNCKGCIRENAPLSAKCQYCKRRTGDAEDKDKFDDAYTKWLKDQRNNHTADV